MPQKTGSKRIGTKETLPNLLVNLLFTLKDGLERTTCFQFQLAISQYLGCLWHAFVISAPCPDLG